MWSTISYCWRQRQELIHWMESNKGKQLQDLHIAVQYFFVVRVVKYSTGWEPPIGGGESRWKVLRTGKTYWAIFSPEKASQHNYLITKFMFCVQKRPFSTVFLQIFIWGLAVTALLSRSVERSPKWKALPYYMNIFSSSDQWETSRSSTKWTNEKT